MKKGNDHIREKKPKRSLKRDELEGWEEKKNFKKRRVKIKKGRKRPDHRAREGPKKMQFKQRKKKPSFFLLSTLHPPHPPSERGVRASHPDKFQPFLKLSTSGLLYGLKI